MGEENMVMDDACQLCGHKFVVKDENEIKELSDFAFLAGMHVHPECFFKNVEEVKLVELGVKHAEQPVSFTGIIMGKSDKKFLTTWTKHECPSCGNMHVYHQIKNEFLAPSRCSCGRKGHFKLIKKKIEEITDLTISDGESVDVRFLYEQVTDFDVGDKIRVTCTIHFENKKQHRKSLNEMHRIISPVKIVLI